MSPMRSGGSSKRAQASALDSTSSTPSSAASRFDERGAVGALRQIDGGEGAERAVMGDVRVGDRQDDARLARAEPFVEQILQIDDVGLAVGACACRSCRDRR